MGWISGVITATGGIFAFAGTVFALVWARRPRAVDHGLVAALGFAVALSQAGVIAGEERLARAGLLAAFAATAHLAVRAYRLDDERRALRVTYGVGIGLLVLSTALAGPTPALLVYVYGILAALAIVTVLARAYIGGEPQTATLVFGAATLLITLLADLASTLGVLRGISVAPIGFLAFLVGLTARFATEHAYAWRELEARRNELVRRTRELHDSNSELRKAQQTLVNKEQLAAVGELAAVVAHEVRNPLAVIGNAVAGLRKASLAREDQETLLEILDSEASRLNRIVTDLLRFARPVTVQRTAIVLSEIVERALALIQKQPKVVVEFSVDVADAKIWGDASLLRQVLDNLIDNAIQAMDGDGTLTVKVRSEGQGPGAPLAVDIIDTGEGMDTQVRSRAKDPFFTTRPSGTGLGLAIVDRIVDAHGGRLVLESRSGEGTKVTLVLPRGTATSEPPTTPKTPPKAIPATGSDGG